MNNKANPTAGIAAKNISSSNQNNQSILIPPGRDIQHAERKDNAQTRPKGENGRYRPTTNSHVNVAF